MAAAASQIQHLQNQFVKGGAGSAQLGKTIDDLIQKQDQLRYAIQKAEQAQAAQNATTSDAATKTQVYTTGVLGASQATEKASNSYRGATGWVRHFTYALDDVNYGISSVINNIPALLGPLGYTGVYMAAAGVAAYSLYRNWDALKESFGNATPFDAAIHSLDEIEKRIKKLKAEVESAPDAKKFAEIANLETVAEVREQAEDAAKKMDKPFQTDAESAESKRWIDAVRESGGAKKLADAMADDRIKRFGPEAFMGSDDLAKYKTAINNKNARSKPVFNEFGQFMYDEADSLRVEGAKSAENLEAKARQKAKEQARQQLGEAATDEGIRARIQLQGDIGAFSPEIADKLSGRTKTQAEIKAREKFDDDAEREHQGIIEAANADQRRLQREKDAETKRIEASEVTGVESRRNNAREQRRAQAERKDWAEEAVPGLDKMAQAAVAKVAIGAMSESDAMNEFKRRFDESGLFPDKKQAGLAAVEAFQRAKGDVQERIAGMAVNGPAQSFRSEIYNASDITNKIQSGVGYGPQQESLGVQKQIERHLADLVRAGQNVLKIQVTP